MSTCRVCGGSEYDREHSVMIKYSTRHYAHADCAIDKWGADFFKQISPITCANVFPIRVARNKGVYDQLIARVYS